VVSIGWWERYHGCDSDHSCLLSITQLELSLWIFSSMLHCKNVVIAVDSETGPVLAMLSTMPNGHVAYGALLTALLDRNVIPHHLYARLSIFPDAHSCSRLQDARIEERVDVAVDLEVRWFPDGHQ
jgi:hypothetical protein